MDSEMKNDFLEEILKVGNKNYEIMAAIEIDKKLNETEENFLKKVMLAEENKNFKEKQENLKLIPKYTIYMEYAIDVIRLLPRVEKFNIGNEYKKIMYETFENIMYLDKIDKKSKMYYLNKIDAGINIQRVYLRIMAKYKWISLEKFNIIMLEKIAEIGRITGGLIKYYAKNSKKSI